MTKMDVELRSELEAMQIEPEGAAITFTAKLARENGWTPRRAEAVMEEYRRFLYLAAKAGRAVTPSDDVDRAWHLHLTYSRHYWGILCGQILGRPLHHDPGDGGAADAAMHRSQYQATLELYRECFGIEPPSAVWPHAAPPVARRLPRAAALGSAAAATLLLAACASAGGSGDSFLGWFPLLVIGGMILLFGIVIVASRRAGRRGEGDCGGSYGGSSCGTSDDSGSDGGSSCGGGCGGGD